MQLDGVAATPNIGALIIRIGFWGPLYYNLLYLEGGCWMEGWWLQGWRGGCWVGWRAGGWLDGGWGDGGGLRRVDGKGVGG